MTDQMREFWDAKAQDNPLWYVHSGLDFAAPDEAEFWRSGEEEVERALDGARISGGPFAVDIGVGAGRLTRALAKRFEQVWSCDVSPEMLEVARANLAGVGNVSLNLVPGDGYLPRLDDEVATFVLSSQVMQHIPSRAAQLTYVREAGRALRPGGHAVFQFRSVIQPDAIGGTAERLARAVVERARRLRRRPPAELDSPAWRGARTGLWEIAAAADDAGMALVRHRWISREGASLLVVLQKA